MLVDVRAPRCVSTFGDFSFTLRDLKSIPVCDQANVSHRSAAHTHVLTLAMADVLLAASCRRTCCIAAPIVLCHSEVMYITTALTNS